MARNPIFDRAIQTAFTGAADQVQRLFVAEARRQLERVKTEARPSGYDQFVDRVKDAPLERVGPYGVIVFEFSYGAEVAEFTLATLRAVSPVLTGKYQMEHAAYVGGSRVSDLSAIGSASRIVITNALPYARKIEGGLRFTGWNSGHRSRSSGAHYDPEAMKTAKGWSDKTTDGSVYKHTVATVNRRFGNIVRASYAWVGLTGEEVGNSQARFPAIVLEAL